MNEKDPIENYEGNPEVKHLTNDYNLESLSGEKLIEAPTEIVKRLGGMEKLFTSNFNTAQRIRDLKKEFYCQDPKLGAERKIEIQEEYEKLKEAREALKIRIMEYITRKDKDLQDYIEIAENAMKNWGRMYESAQADNLKNEMRRLKPDWLACRDLVNLYRNDYDDITLDQEEDDPLSLEGVQKAE